MSHEVSGTMESAVTGGRRGLRSLILLNVGLLGVLALVTFGGSLMAQVRPPSDYVMVAGRANGSPGGVVYIADTVNREMIAVTYDHNLKDIAGVGYRNIAADMSGGTMRGGK